MLGWMNNWDYAGDIPTSTWRSAMSLPREVRLVSTPKGPRLTQRVVPQVEGLRRHQDATTLRRVAVGAGHKPLPVTGDLVQVDAVLDLGSASAAGISVLGGGGSETRIGYDVRRGELFVDRTRSGDVSFHPSFASVERAPVTARGGVVSFSVYVDRASVEVFTADGLTTITDQVFPEPGAQDIGAWAEGGRARLTSLTVTPLEPAMWVR
jgi:levanase